MSSPTREPQTPDHASPRPSGQPASKERLLSPAQVAGSALAASSATFASSYLGVAGTIIGAALFSVIATVGTAAYTASLRRSSQAVRRTAQTVREQQFRPVLNRQGRVIGVRPQRPEDTAVLEGAGAPPTGRSRGSDDPRAHTTWKARIGEWGAQVRELPKKRLAVAAAVVCLITFAVLSAIELSTNRTISNIVGANNDKGSSFSHMTGGGGSAPTKTPSSKVSATPSSAAHSSAPKPTSQSTPTTTPSATAIPRSTPSASPSATRSSSASASASAAPTSSATNGAPGAGAGSLAGTGTAQ